tara:strand:- start:214 stop:423 length:210 start_codon:yes stop_codon:yes gene_type:complete
MATITLTTTDARQEALTAEATAQGGDNTPTTIAQGAVDSLADQRLRDKYISWFKNQGVSGMGVIYDANQ